MIWEPEHYRYLLSFIYLLISLSLLYLLIQIFTFLISINPVPEVWQENNIFCCHSIMMISVCDIYIYISSVNVIIDLWNSSIVIFYQEILKLYKVDIQKAFLSQFSSFLPLTLKTFWYWYFPFSLFNLTQRKSFLSTWES